MIGVSGGRLMMAVDIDGTLIREDGRSIATRVIRAVREIVAFGHYVVLATGRVPAAVLPVALELGLSGSFAVCSNGTVTVRLGDYGSEIVDARSFDPRVVAAMLPPGCALAVELPGGTGFRYSDTFPHHELPNRVAASPSNGREWAAGRVVVHGYPAAEAVGRALGLSVVRDGPIVEIAPAHTSKASALETLRTHLGVRSEDCVAVGNGMNDLDMLVWAARGFATSDAPCEVQAVATRVVPGVAEVLERYIHNRRAEASPYRSVAEQIEG